MGYNKELDQELWSREKEIDDKHTTIKVGVYSYNGGEEKLRIIKKVPTATGILFLPLSSFTLLEFTFAKTMIDEAVEYFKSMQPKVINVTPKEGVIV